MADKARVVILISGAGSNMAALIYAARADDCPYEVVLVSGDNPDAPGLQLAEAEGIKVARLPRPDKGNRAHFFADLDATLRDAEVDLVALAGFMRILPAEFVERWTGRLLNIHPSLLPNYRGLDTHARALAAGDRDAGCSVHFVTAEVDAGEILGQVKVAVLPDDTPDTLAARVRIAEHQLFPRILGEVAARPLDAGWIEARVDALAAALPEVGRKTSHGAPGWAVGREKTAKLFAIIADHHHGEDTVGLLVKASGADEMTGLIEARPDHYYWPKYYGASGWLGLRLSRRDVDWDEVGEWLERSWRAAAPPRLTKFLRVADEF
ncbi:MULTISPECIES: phosphoribosylglycinamide formyltransferase [Sphingomonas]|uniref:phosphoribosylglycinamide formyltransferase n=1 Tax=Sphingomonas TaxID=13687 RepID=UPI000DF01A93|nr:MULTISPECIES: phosphoribosylglycinamide formyltransferase [Sphingomonas]